MKKAIAGIALAALVAVALGSLCIFTCNTCGKLRFDKFNSYVLQGIEGNMCTDCREAMLGFLP